MRLLKATLLFQILVGLYWMFPVAMDGVRGSGGLYLLVLVFVPLLAVVPIAIWLFFKRPETRRLAVVVFFVPLMIFLAPILFRAAFSGIVGSPGGGFAEASTVTVLVLFGVLVLLPGRVAGYIPRSLLRSHLFNATLVVSLSVMLLAWLVILSLLKIVITHDERSVVFVLFALVYTIVCALIAPLILIYSYYAMFQRDDREHHKLRIAQLALSIAVLLPTAFGLLFFIKIAPLLTPPG
jgi:hypothetical protein